MLQLLHTPREILWRNRALPDSLRQSSVVIQFASGSQVPARRLAEFRRIHLTPAMLAGGEDRCWRPEIVQPHRVGRQMCTSCRGPLERIAETDYRCLNPRCLRPNGRLTSTLIQRIEPHRGVVRVDKQFTAEYRGKPRTISFVAGRESYTGPGGIRRHDELVGGCLLVLDRRYRDTVLCAVYRTAGELCDLVGWKMM